MLVLPLPHTSTDPTSLARCAGCSRALRAHRRMAMIPSAMPCKRRPCPPTSALPECSTMRRADSIFTRYRAYDPLAGRWLSRDPLGEATDPASNLYAYVEGNPIGFADLLGLYDIVVVTTATGVVYRPMTTVKNSAQAAQYGQPLGSKVPIAVPPGVNPQAKVNSWADTLFKGPVPLRPTGGQAVNTITSKPMRCTTPMGISHMARLVQRLATPVQR